MQRASWMGVCESLGACDLDVGQSSQAKMSECWRRKEEGEAGVWREVHGVLPPVQTLGV